MRSRIALIAAVFVVALSGCGGGGDEDEPSTTTTAPATPASAQSKAVDDFAAAAQAYWDDFRNCGTRVTPTRGFFEACTKRTRGDFQEAGNRVLRSLERYRTGGCKGVANRLRGVMARLGAALERTVVAFDRSNDAALEKRSYGGPAPQQLFLDGQRSLEEDVPAARKLSRQIDEAC